MEDWTIYLIAGIVVITFSLLRYNIKRRRREAEENARRRAALQAAREAEARRQREMGQPVKIKPGSLRSNQPERMPLPDPVPATFTGSETPRNIARWETEIHEIGRQIMGKIDSKMIAIQTLTLEANRTANRLELLLERFEQLTKPQNPAEPAVEIQEPEPEMIPEVIPAVLPETAVEPEPAVPTANVLRSTEQNAEAFADILNDLESEIEQLEQREEPAPAAVTVLKAENVEERPVMPENLRSNDVLSLNSPGLPGGHSSAPQRPTELRSSLSFESLYDNSLAGREGGEVFAVAAPAAVASFSGTSSETESDRSRTFSSPRHEPVKGSRLDLRRQVEMMADYGNTPRQIAQTLNITVGEVDLMLSLRD